MAKQVRGLVVNRPAKSDEELPAIEAKHRALNLIARRAGFTNYQHLTTHFWDRLIAATGDQLDSYPAIDAEIKAIVHRAVDSLQALPKRPK